ncbi:hypothetical protein EMIHUDRAFT_459759 [Emiliania huxleyi CCMP1516]|uniref:Peptidase S1 domain-containing protein n=3 Tax=Emiliania huxleyi TaxID=2903 RepID=A0A0D3I1X8_EMIH1|nr:hypothetical protein EMIHUDRAFT_448594 [Emiliania huxleyi CCMP1516]XP_005763933.1 hypothetical protein EMIHUDRAFT_459759 [Emiliania huxleyi CCMP1516]EOD05263.1 hypothetical protein EMIHUDRAFT_448594 [Emiliania huxleyi CCMP1516]EOD11504.1 hypothetical protein EMIHUDRAFT_459759 [Emiliania huxleyi CCMP1516]|eukprot:XP_005757692.1 hypothetical protein EMIHUDRAFT_448594 [Emiliania huxleyi CCMP1516]
MAEPIHSRLDRAALEERCQQAERRIAQLERSNKTLKGKLAFFYESEPVTARDAFMRLLTELMRASRRYVHRLRLAASARPRILLSLLVLGISLTLTRLLLPTPLLQLPVERRPLRAAVRSCSRSRLRHVYLCRDAGGRLRECLCDPPRVGGGGCNESDADMCNAGGQGPYWRFFHELPEAERSSRLCFGLFAAFKPARREPGEAERQRCLNRLERSYWPEAVRYGGGVSLVLALLLVRRLERNADPALKAATLRVGLLHLPTGRFADMGSGAVVKRDAGECYILTAAHVLVGYRARRARDEYAGPDCLLTLGVYEGDAKPARWVAWASCVTPDSLLRSCSDDGATLQDLAVLKVGGALALDPPAYGKAQNAFSRFEVAARSDDPAEGVGRMPPPLELDRSRRALAHGADLSVCGWASWRDSMRQLYLDRSRCLGVDSGLIRSRLWVHAGSSGGPCVNAASQVVGVVSHDNDAHADPKRFWSSHRAVTELTPEHGLPPEVYEPETVLEALYFSCTYF